MKAILIACLLLFVAFCFFVATGDSDSSNKRATIIDGRQESNRQFNVQAALTPTNVSALKLFIDYQRNEVAADNVYKGRLLAVRGIVSDISKDLFDKIYVSLATSNQFMHVQAHLQEGNESKAAALQKGESVTVLCIGDGMIIGSPMLQQCSFDDTQDRSMIEEPPSSIAQIKPDADTSGPVEQGAEVGANNLYKIGGAVSAPQVIFQVEPEFTEEARTAKTSGNVLVNIWVGTDGRPSHVQVVHGLDHGLDEKAIEAVSQYRFTPAKLNGVAVPVELNVQVAFQIF